MGEGRNFEVVAKRLSRKFKGCLAATRSCPRYFILFFLSEGLAAVQYMYVTPFFSLRMLAENVDLSWLPVPDLTCKRQGDRAWRPLRAQILAAASQRERGIKLQLW